ncbi:DUF2066 domain-containing protein [Shewanella intestini]|uniref:DUF2066 domain-containing protein n=1 Tax=Shewanella intestini TaxID=2017544 RepID=A0ABS5HZD6_9GAMM|nr:MULTISPECIES: DUF2066 domain-containing protein [Shewanella]MBR9727107.1 DUF2066 domain-containing protein [Shewanella intestini]MRG35909.1 DUF2066 domain-containing protein [Shewanella sp. XMDDZSB0408]
MLKNIPNVIVLAICALLLCTSASAVEIQNLDQANIKVDSRGKTERNHALKQALSVTFIKNSGDASVLSDTLIKEYVQNPNRLLTQYVYYQQDNALYLKAIFDHQRLIQVLRQAQLPVWGNQRPLTLLWLSMPQASVHEIVADAAQFEAKEHITHYATNQGIPILFPLMDLDDSMQVNVTDVRGKFATVIERASERYDVEYFVVANMDNAADEVRYQMSLYEKNHHSGLIQALVNYQGSALDENLAAEQIIDQMSAYFVSRYAIASSGDNLNTLLKLEGVSSMKDIVDIEHYLGELTAVKSIIINQIADNTVTYSIELFNQVDDLKRLLNINNRFEMLPALLPSTDDSYIDPIVTAPAPLTYRWHSR